LVKKKVDVIPLEQKRMMINRDNQQLSIIKQCELLSINRSGIYYVPVPEKEENLVIMRILDEQYLETPFYGVERLFVLLIGLGYRVNRKRLRRLIGIMGWRTLYPTRRTTIINPSEYKYPYLLKKLEISKKNQVWEIDITYIPMKNGFMYLFAIIDVHTRFIVGWSLSNTMTANWCIETIKEAILIHGKPEIINSDQGSQFTCKDYVDFLLLEEIKISMDGKGRAIDNIYIERFWRSIKYEHVYLFAYENGNDLWRGINKYIDFYNQKRMHQSLENMTPKSLYYKNVA
jgi:putative transposase